MEESILYLECSSGISGDMTVAALLDLGADETVLRQALASLPLKGYSIEIKTVYKSGLKAKDFHVLLDPQYENHDHDMEYLYGHGHASHGEHFPGSQDHAAQAEPLPASCDHPAHAEPLPDSHDHAAQAEPLPTSCDHPAHGIELPNGLAHEEEIRDKNGYTSPGTGTHDNQELPLHEDEIPDGHMHAADGDGTVNEHSHKHTHEHAHHGRNLTDVLAILRAGNLTPNALALAEKIFTILARAEAQVHGKPIDEVHFHEVGAVDSIVDIAAAAVCLDNLHPEHVVVSPLTDGVGQVRCQHGLIPVPVPAVTAIAAQEHLTLRPSGIQGELVTPTGAAIAAAVRSMETLPAQYQIRKIGLGAGKRDYEASGILRAMLIQAELPVQEDVILELETNIDDCSGEAIAFTMQQLLAAGALDAFSIPVYMKKNRPAWLLKVLCDPQDRKTMEDILFENTTTIGIRRREMRRTKLPREIRTIETPWGPADIKVCKTAKGDRFYPENDSIARLSVRNGIGFSEMYGLVQSFAREQSCL